MSESKQNRPHFSVVVQDHFGLAKRYEAFVTPFAFLIDERGVISVRGIVSTKQFLSFVLSGAGHEKDGDDAAETFPRVQALSTYAGEASLSYSKEVDHL